MEGSGGDGQNCYTHKTTLSKLTFFTPGRARSQMFPNYKLALHKSTAQQLSIEWSLFRVLFIESKVRKLCIT